MRKLSLMAASAAIIFAVGFAQPAEAKKRHHYRHHHSFSHTPTYKQGVGSYTYDNDGRVIYNGPSNARTVYDETGAQARYRGRRSVVVQQVQPTIGGFTSNSLVSEARKYIGTNPTGRGSLWCGAFMDLVLKNTGHAGGGNLASAYARYGTSVSGPQVGAIAVMGRRGGGHVGIVTGIDANGNPIIISGNTWSRESGGRRSVLEHAYPRGRIYAYVVP